MLVEFLYPEISNLLGENGNLMMLEAIFGKDKVVRTCYPSPPRFLDGSVKLVFMGAMTENKQELVLKTLMPHKDQIKKRIEDGQFILFTGNSLDLLGQEIIHEEGPIHQGLGLFDFKTRVNRYDRINSFVHGFTKKGSEIFGWISQFTNYSGDLPYLLKSNDKSYGIHYRNLYATSLLGPLLITSPYFTKELLGAMGMDTALPHEEDLIKTFKERKRHMEANKK